MLLRYSRLNAELHRQVMPSVAWFTEYFLRQMSSPETYLSRYPIPKILALLRTVFPDSEDDIPYWDYEMYSWIL